MFEIFFLSFLLTVIPRDLQHLQMKVVWALTKTMTKLLGHFGNFLESMERWGGGVIVMYSHTRCMQITLRKPPKQRFDGTLKGTPIKQVTGVNFLKNQCASCHSVFTLSMYNTCISSIFLFISLWYLYCCASFPLPPLKIFKVSALFYHTHQGLSPIKAFFRAIAIHSSNLFRPFFFLLKFYELKTINW